MIMETCAIVFNRAWSHKRGGTYLTHDIARLPKDEAELLMSEGVVRPYERETATATTDGPETTAPKTDGPETAHTGVVNPVVHAAVLESRQERKTKLQKRQRR